MPFLTRSICSMSWIDSKSGLKKIDADPGKTVTQADVFGKQKCRFANFLEATVFATSDGGQITSGIITSRSGQFVASSFAAMAATAFTDARSVLPGAPGQPWKFVQTVGSRTVSPDHIAKAAGGAVGAGIGAVLAGPFGLLAGIGMGGAAGSSVGGKVLDAISGSAGAMLATLPPIWSTLELTIFPDGTHQARVLKHSLFPSMSFYMPKSWDEATDGYVLTGAVYDGVPQLNDWIAEGWGLVRPLAKMKQGLPHAGNPWGILKSTK